MPAINASAEPRPTGAIGRHAVAAGLVLLVVLAYANSLQAPFVYDDVLSIPQNTSIRQLWPLTDVLFPKLEGGVTAAGRPVLNLSFALNHAISGNAVWSYHVFNILVHAGSALLLFGIARRTVQLHRPATDAGTRSVPGTGTASADYATLLGACIAAWWALHPLHTQAITYTVQRAESLMGFFYLLTVYGFIRYSTAGHGARTHWAAITVGACALGMATKEVMATAPVLVLLYDRTFVAGRFTDAWRARGRLHLALAATWLLLAAVMLTAGGNRGGTVGLGVGVPLWAYPLTQFQAIARYLGLGLWPHALVFEYGTFWALRPGDILPYVPVVLPLLVATVVALWRWPVAGFLGAWFFVILAPTSLMPGTIQMIVEHRVYLPLIAVIAGLVLALHRLAGTRAALAGTVAALALGVATARRNHDYRSHLALWHDTVVKRPLNPRAHEGIAEALAEVGRTDDAVKHRAEAIRLLPDESTYHYNLGVTLSEAGRFEDAIRHYELSLRLVPTEARAHNNLAVALAKLGRHEQALRHYAEAARLKPDEAQYHYNHGIALLRAGRTDEAVAAYQTALQVQPAHTDSHFNLAAALVKLKRYDEALSHYAEAVRLRPDDVEYRSMYGLALLRTGLAREAVTQFQHALTAKPAAVDALLGLGDAMYSIRQYADSAVAYERVLAQQPNHASAQFKLGNALLELDRVPAAAAHFEAAVRLAPDDAEAQHNLGVAFARQERWTEARRQFETALSLKPDYPAARRNLEQLRQVMGK